MKMPPIVPSYEWMNIKFEPIIPELNSNKSWKESFQKLKDAAEELRAIFVQMADEMKKLREESEALDSEVVEEPIVPSQPDFLKKWVEMPSGCLEIAMSSKEITDEAPFSDSEQEINSCEDLVDLLQKNNDQVIPEEVSEEATGKMTRSQRNFGDAFKVFDKRPTKNVWENSSLDVVRYEKFKQEFNVSWKEFHVAPPEELIWEINQDTRDQSIWVDSEFKGRRNWIFDPGGVVNQCIFTASEGNWIEMFDEIPKREVVWAGIFVKLKKHTPKTLVDNDIDDLVELQGIIGDSFGLIRPTCSFIFDPGGRNELLLQTLVILVFFIPEEVVYDSGELNIMDRARHLNHCISVERNMY